MFGTMGFSELIIILVIVLIIFGAGRLPQIGENNWTIQSKQAEVHITILVIERRSSFMIRRW